MHHVGIVTADIEATIRHYVETFGCDPPRVVCVDKPGIKLKTAMVAIGAGQANCLQLIEPEVGPGVEELKHWGEGTLLEVAFEVEDIEQVYDQMKMRGIQPVNLIGERALSS